MPRLGVFVLSNYFAVIYVPVYSSYPARTRRNIEESDGTVIFSLERPLSGGTKLTWEHANKLGKPVLHIYDTRKERISNPDSLRLEVQALTDFLRSNKIEVLNVAGPRESKEPGVYEWTLTMLRFSLNRAASGAGSKETVGEWTQCTLSGIVIPRDFILFKNLNIEFRYRSKRFLYF